MDLEPLRYLANEAINEYRELYSDEIPVQRSEAEKILEEGSQATREDLEGYTEDQIEFYDELLDVDASDFRGELEEGLRYDWASTPERVFNLREEGDPESTAYSAIRDLIKVEVGSKPEVYRGLASELFHAYQFKTGSDTWADPFLREGLERAASLKALEDEYPERAQAFRTHVLTDGYVRAARLKGEEPDLEVGDQVVKEIRENQESGNVDAALGYNLPASLINAAEDQHGEQVYREIFHGDLTSIQEGLDFMEANSDDLDLRLKASLWKLIDPVLRSKH
jgi:hypothetical protein